jgi:hypothetical protein
MNTLGSASVDDNECKCSSVQLTIVQQGKNKDKNRGKRTEDRAIRNPLKTGMNSGAPDGLVVPTSLVTPVVLLLLQTR